MSQKQNRGSRINNNEKEHIISCVCVCVFVSMRQSHSHAFITSHTHMHSGHSYIFQLEQRKLCMCITQAHNTIQYFTTISAAAVVSLALTLFRRSMCRIYKNLNCFFFSWAQLRENLCELESFWPNDDADRYTHELLLVSTH